MLFITEKDIEKSYDYLKSYALNTKQLKHILKCTKKEPKLFCELFTRDLEYDQVELVKSTFLKNYSNLSKEECLMFFPPYELNYRALNAFLKSSIAVQLCKYYPILQDSDFNINVILETLSKNTELMIAVINNDFTRNYGYYAIAELRNIQYNDEILKQTNRIDCKLLYKIMQYGYTEIPDELFENMLIYNEYVVDMYKYAKDKSKFLEMVIKYNKDRLLLKTIYENIEDKELLKQHNDIIVENAIKTGSLLPDEIVENMLDDVADIIECISDKLLIKYIDNDAINKHVYYKRYNDLLEEIPIEKIKQEYRDDKEFLINTPDFNISTFVYLMYNKQNKLAILERPYLQSQILEKLIRDEDEEISKLAKDKKENRIFKDREEYIQDANSENLTLEQVDFLLNLDDITIHSTLYQNENITDKDIIFELKESLKNYSFDDLYDFIAYNKLRLDIKEEMARQAIKKYLDTDNGSSERVKITQQINYLIEMLPQTEQDVYKSVYKY